MSELLEQISKELDRKIPDNTSSLKDHKDQEGRRKLLLMVAGGVLLLIIAQADDHFMEEERNEIETIFRDKFQLNERDFETIYQLIVQFAKARVDLYQFTHEINEHCGYLEKVHIVELLFRVACSDADLDELEVEQIRKIANLIHVSHKDFINAKLKIKNTFS